MLKLFCQQPNSKMPQALRFVCVCFFLLLVPCAGKCQTECLCFILHDVYNFCSVTATINVKAARGHFFVRTTSLFTPQIKQVTKIHLFLDESGASVRDRCLKMVQNLVAFSQVSQTTTKNSTHRHFNEISASY